ncbi:MULTISPECIES: PucR family transcriptional regulator ligand-binding domain-containing protein [Vagococcus]|uniref:Regulator of polyketide synthase expression n=1 Tax=Vagococcus fluvialis bH819 TaxID=1255619 RepID=A0A1X6WQS3_9ENTE|nr:MULTISPECIES: PucR family transcriptional regulator ligand-binding domain-containing protein [Vagococcus]SLM86640.1 Regulator of polyketide synthase expression [Vagococcus fluvialis bH819]HCM90848.1 PucR family transcriptional regulator [Vagococcus sp.]
MTLLKDILPVPRFSDFKLLTENHTTEIELKNVDISETPDIANFTPSHTLVLTTAMVYKDNQLELKQLIDSLVSIKAAGLGIKIGRFIDTIDQEIIDYANNQSFAIIQIPETQRLGSVLQKFSSFINQSKTEQISYALDIQKQFSNLILNDATFSKIITEFSHIINCPVILLDPFKEALSVSTAPGIFNFPTKKIIQQLIKQNAFGNSHETTSKLVDLGNNSQPEVAVYPIKNNNFFPYYLIIISPENIPYPVSEFAIDQALLVLSFVLLKNDKVLDSQKQIKSDYFINLIERQQKNLINEKNWLSYDTHFGIQLSNFYQIIYVTMDNSLSNNNKIKLNEEKMKLAYQWLDKKITDFFEDALIFPEKNSPHLIIMLQKKSSQRNITDSLIQLAGQLKGVLPIDLLFSCGQIYESIEAIATSLVEAKIVWEEGKKKQNTNSVTFYKSKGILNLFDSMPSEEIKYFCQKLLKELAFPSESMYIELRKTLKTFLNNQCEITKTANDLFIHRNTVKYRIDNCEEILGLDISLPENSLNLRLALELSE